MPGNSGNKSNKPKLHGSTNSLRDTFNQALNEATTAEQAKSGANLGEGHSNKSNNTNFADLQEWYIKQNAATKSAMAKLTDEPTSVLSKEERDSLYRNVSPYYYQRYLQFRYSDKPEFIRDRMKSFYGFKRNVEDNGLVPKDSAETKPETQYAEQAVKEQANSAKSAEEKTLDDVWADSLGIPRSELNSAKPNTASQPAANSEKVTPERQAAQDMINHSINNSRSKNETGDAHIPWYNQSWRSIINNSRDKNTPSSIPPNRLTGDAYPIVRPNPLDLSFDEKVYRPWAEKYGERARPNSKTVISKREDKSLTPHVDFTWRENTDNLPFYNKNAVNRHIPDATHAPEFYLNPVEPLAAPYEYGPIVTRKAAEKAYDQKLNREIAIENAIKDGLWGLGILGATAGTFYGLDRLGKYIRQDDSDERPQTQVPYRIEPEPVNEAAVQAELTPEQQFVLQSTSPFDYAKGANLFDLYDRYGSPNSPIKIDPVEDKELIDEAMSDFESPQNPPAVGTNINDANLVIPDADEAPEELNDAMLDARPGSFWKATRGVIAPKVNAAKNAFGRALARSKAAPVITDKSADSAALNTPKQRKSASSIQDTSNGPIVLNDPNHRKVRDVQNNSITPEQAAASQIVNQYAGIPVEVIRAKNSGYSQPPLNHATDAIWDRVRKAGLSSPEQAIRSGLFTPAEVRYITENDLWRYR